MNISDAGAPDRGLAPTILPLKQSDGPGNVFFLPDVGGNVFYAKKIVSQLVSGCGVYAMRLDSELLENLPGCTIQGLAHRFAADLNASVFTGPLHLIGHSFAGFLAFETARRVVELGAYVGSITLLDCAVPDRFRSGWYYQTAGDLYQIKNWLRDLLKKTAFADSNDDPSMLLSEPGFIRMDLTKHPEPYRYIIRHLYRAMVDYEPGLYSGNLTLFQATDQLLFGVPKDFGWGTYTKGRVDVIRITGDHLEMVRDDRATKEVAKSLDRILAAASCA